MDSESAVAPVLTPRPTANAAPVTGPLASATPVAGTFVSSDDMPRITVQELKAKLDAGQAVVFDARRQSDYTQKHIAGAISLPQDEVAARLAELPTDKLAVFYCT
ncbi:MAG: rhodanese-like domain-containing protein [Anaerolineae bacterium]